MIGSSTLLVKRDGMFSVHIFSGFAGMIQFLDKKAKKQTPFQYWSKLEKKWGKPDAVISADEAEQILHSHQCANKEEPFYSEFVGDSINLLDYDLLQFFEVARQERPRVYGTEYWKAKDTWGEA
jgi:hypothetical protein